MNSHSAEIIQITGDIDFARLKEAIAIAIDKQPILKCCIKPRLFGFDWVPLPEGTPISIERCDYSHLSELEIKDKIAEHTWCRKADFTAERLVRFYLIYTGDDKYYLQSVSHHASADAQSGYNLFKDIAKIYTALTHSQPIDRSEYVVNRRDVGRVYLNKLPFSERVKIFCRGIKAFLSKPGFKVTGLNLPNPKEEATRSIYSDALPDDMLDKLKKAAKHYNTSVHVLFVLGMIKYQHRFNNDTERLGFQLLDVLTMRQFSDEASVSMSYDAFSINHFKDFDTNKPETEIIRDVTNYITGLKNGKIFEDWYQQKLWVGAFLMLPPFLRTKYVTTVLDDKLRSNMLISNLGVFNFDSYDFGNSEVTDFFSFPNVGGPLRLGFFFCTFRNRLKLTLVYDSRCFTQSMKEAVVEPFTDILNEICSVVEPPKSVTGSSNKAEVVDAV